MGDVVPFRREKPRWTRPEDYGLPPEDPREPRPPRRPSRFMAGLRPWILLSLLLALFTLYDPALVEPPRFLASEPEPVAGKFTRCGPGRGNLCVIDGDTFKIGERKIRLIGIDAPETHSPKCPAEAQLGEAATAELQRLLNLGPFILLGRIDAPTDKYGRELRAALRKGSDGSDQSIADTLIASGKVKRYLGGLRGGWCSASTPG